MKTAATPEIPDLENRISSAVTKAREETLVHVGKELHDNINQLLVSAKLYFSMCKIPEPGSKYMHKGQELLAEAIQQIRYLSRGMATPKLPGNALIANVNTLAAHLKETTTLQVYFIHSLSGRQISGAKGLALFRIIQEQVKNVLTHSGATALSISISSDATAIELTMHDNGVGIKEQLSEPGMGLKNIEGRVKAFNGIAEIYSKRGKGYRLKVVLPRRVY